MANGADGDNMAVVVVRVAVRGSDLDHVIVHFPSTEGRIALDLHLNGPTAIPIFHVQVCMAVMVLFYKYKRARLFCIDFLIPITMFNHNFVSL